MTREEAIQTLLALANAVGAYGLGLTWAEVQSAPDDACEALNALGVTDTEIEAATDG